jgi:hypothetical protein
MIGLVNCSTIISQQSRRFGTQLFNNTHVYCVLLRESIDSIYNEEDWMSRGVLPYRKDRLIEELFLRNYYPSSVISYFIIKESEIPAFIYNLIKIESYRGHLWLEPRMEDNQPVGVAVYQLNNPVDLLLMMSFSQVLVKTLIVDLPPNVIKFNDLKVHHYAFLNRQEKVYFLHKIDLTPSIKHIDKFRMLNSFQYVRNIPVIYDLIKEFIDLKIYDEKNGKYLNNHGVPPIGELTNVIYHVFYQHVFDRAIEELYPGITYTRWGHQVFIAIKEPDCFLFNDIEINKLLDKLDLAGNIESINYDSLSYLVGSEEEKIVFLREDGSVEVWRTEEV